MVLSTVAHTTQHTCVMVVDEEPTLKRQRCDKHPVQTQVFQDLDEDDIGQALLDDDDGMLDMMHPNPDASSTGALVVRQPERTVREHVLFNEDLLQLLLQFIPEKFHAELIAVNKHPGAGLAAKKSGGQPLVVT